MRPFVASGGAAAGCVLIARALVLALALLAVLPAAASAGVRSGSGVDASGDQTDPQRDIVALSASYDTAGAIAVVTTLREAPTAASDGFLFVRVGTPAATGCQDPSAGVGSRTDPALTTALALASEDTSTSIPATKAGNGATITLSVTNAAFAGKGYTCVTAEVSDPAQGSTTVYDATDTPVTLAAPQAQPAPSPVPISAAPVLTRAQKLTRALRACRTKKPLATRRACERTARARYGPPLTRAQKLTRALRACTSVRTAAGRKRCVTRARASFGPLPKTPLGGRVYYYPGVDTGFVCGGVCWMGYTFVDSKWAYTGIRETDGLFPACTARTATADKDGCVPYTFNAATNTGTIDGKPFSVTADRSGLTVDGSDLSYFLGSAFAPGERRALYLKGISVFGSPFVGTQTVIQRWLALGPDGRFILSSLVLGSNAPGNAVQVHFQSYPPDQKGRYEFLEGGLVRLTYENGKVSTENVFVLGDRTKEDPQNAGIFLAGTQFFKE